MAPITTFTLTFRTVLLYVLTGMVVLLFVLYVLFQARFILAGPQITFTGETTVAHTTRLVTVEGQAKNITHMTLNGRQIYTDTYGNFKEALVLENGYTIATLRAEDRYGRTTNLTRTFVLTKNKQPTIN